MYSISQEVRSSLTVSAFYFSQKNTEEQNTQSFTETLSQPNSQNVTANVSWKASVFSVCRRPSVSSKCAPKGSVNSVRSVREKTPQRVSSVPFLIEGAFYFSQKNTEEQISQSFTETLSQPISQNLTANRGLTPSPSPNGEGSDHRDTPTRFPYVQQPIPVL